MLSAPFPWFGGKKRVADSIWQRFGDVPNYIEPFAGSAAVLLRRPSWHKGFTETINDADGLVANFWRALKHSPEEVARYADNPVNENDLHARHAWLVQRKDSLAPRLEGDPRWFDAEMAGWWAWGISCWIGSGFCSGNGPWHVVDRQLVHLGDDGRGVNRKRVHLGDDGMGVNRKRVHLGSDGMGVNRKRVHLGDDGRGVNSGLLDYLQSLAERLRYVRVCCGDWSRVLGPSVLFSSNHSRVAVFLDPPYADTADRQSDLYRVDSESVAHGVREWALEWGADPRVLVCLAGYVGEHAMPGDWEEVAWSSSGGFLGAKSGSRGESNRHKERLWFSPSCRKTLEAAQGVLFGADRG